MKLVAGNWKMNPGTLEEARKLATAVEHAAFRLTNRIEVVVAAPSIYLGALKHTLQHVRLAAQNVSAEPQGPFTGEISAGQLKDLGVRYVLVGHSERRALGEDDEMINRKLKLCRENNLHPILCVGFGTTKTMSDARVNAVVQKELSVAIKGVRFEPGTLTIAYEPVWAISRGPGTAVLVPAEHAATTIEFIKSKYHGYRVIYGGSVTAKNAPELAQYSVIEGVLPGGASLKADDFLSIIKAFI